MAGCEGRRGISVHPAAAEVGAERLASARTGLQLGGLGAARAQDLLDLSLDLLQVHEFPVDRGEADVGDLVQVAQAVHDHLADFAAWDLHAAGAAELGLDVVDDGAQALRGDVALFGRLLQPVEELLRVEVFAAPVLLGDEEGYRLDAFVSREALPTLQALSPASNRLPHLGVARVDDLQVVMAAVWAAHSRIQYSYIRFRRNAGMLISPSSSAPNSGRSKAGLRTWSCLASLWVLPAKPVAMTVILISPCIVSSRTTPKMMLAFGSAADRTISAAF